MAKRDEKWFYNLSTGEVTEGPESSWANRMGPYDSRQEAEDALKIAQERNEEADAQDEEWEDED
ncbi:hypothetical protein CPHO_03820 [Corynebacterium phocae]|uniref:SPOR domain-containing protein n=1 Tax=Corynebacterium phocae TaxID=161895 RepID=A0A1L7D1X3_9CORY|nr:hypothetical protein [Corynebacterium phocae]APT92156.1 hypothetical protein CPHO_03820 [Corynebacterium phocae]KAA8725942.1 hypothetical protein F4V58_03370 [Corynebacterium phocae]